MATLSRHEGEALLERFRRHLRDHRQPVTRQRELLAEIVLSSGEHLSADAIIRRLEDKGEKVGTATVYRTLELLVQSGVARVHDFGEGYRRYEAMAGPDDHEHLVCVRCGRVEEFTNERLERMLPVIADEHHFQPHRHRVEIFGLCQTCQRLDLGGLT